MKIPVILALSAALAAANPPTGLPVFRIDLNDEPHDRFLEPVAHFAPQVKDLLGKYEPLFPTAVVKAFRYLDWMIQLYHPERYEEIVGIADVIGAESHIVIMVNYVYEFTSFCTSLIAKQEDGLIMHLRLLDFNFPYEMRGITYVAEFYKGAEYQYEAVMFAGLAAMQTGFKRGAFSISINQRTPTGGRGWDDFLENAAMIFMSYQQPSWVIRDTLAECQDYACAFKRLSNEKLIAPAYLVLAGTKGNEGAIITRSRFTIANITTLDDEHWYLVQTNSDHFSGECPTRCIAARQNFEKLGRANLTVTRGYKEVLAVFPNLNDISIHSSIMVPAQGIFQSQLVYSTHDGAQPNDF